MTKNPKRIKQTVLEANAPQADSYSFGANQTGTFIQQGEPRGSDEEGVDHTVTMLDYEGSPVVTATGTPERETRSARPEI